MFDYQTVSLPSGDHADGPGDGAFSHLNWRPRGRHPVVRRHHRPRRHYGGPQMARQLENQ